jgi:hypothetical protein
MQKRKFLTISIVVLGILFLYSCSYDTLVPEKINPDKKVVFSTDIQPVFTQNCITCHSGSLAPDLREGKSYASLFAGSFIDTITPEQSVLYREMAPNGGMSSYTNVSDAQLVLLWIQQGAHE